MNLVLFLLHLLFSSYTPASVNSNFYNDESNVTTTTTTTTNNDDEGGDGRGGKFGNGDYIIYVDINP